MMQFEQEAEIVTQYTAKTKTLKEKYEKELGQTNKRLKKAASKLTQALKGQSQADEALEETLAKSVKEFRESNLSIAETRREIKKTQKAKVAFNDVADAWLHFKLLEPDTSYFQYEKVMKVY